MREIPSADVTKTVARLCIEANRVLIADFYRAVAANTALVGPVDWLLSEASNPYSCAAMGEIVSLLATWGVSRFTRKLPVDHLHEVFGA